MYSIKFLCSVIVIRLSLAGANIQEEPCSSYPGVCKSKGDCPQGSLSKIGGAFSCPSSPDDIECCPTGGGGGYTQEEPCKSYPGVCKPKGECPQGSLTKIGGAFSCPSSPDDIECCPTGGGGGYTQEEPCRSYPGVCKPKRDCPNGSLTKIGGAFSCPSSPDDIECCPGNNGGGSGGGGGAIVAAARSQIGVPYVWGGGNQHGPTKGGFDCSGLSQYAVFKGTGRLIPRTAQTQHDFIGCASVPIGSRQPGDIVFWGNSGGVYHDAIVSGPDMVIHAPETGKNVREVRIFTRNELKGIARRCY